MLVICTQAAPLLGISRVVVGNQVFQQSVLIVKACNNFGLDPAVHHHVIPRGDSGQVGVDTRRHVGVWPHEGNHRFRSCYQVTPVRVGLGAVAKQQSLIALTFSFGKQMKRQRRDKRQPIVVCGYQVGKRMRTHQLVGCSIVLGGKLGRQIHVYEVCCRLACSLTWSAC